MSYSKNDIKNNNENNNFLVKIIQKKHPHFEDFLEKNKTITRKRLRSFVKGIELIELEEKGVDKRYIDFYRDHPVHADKDIKKYLLLLDSE